MKPVALLLEWALSGAAAADGGRGLRHDPFRKPELPAPVVVPVAEAALPEPEPELPVLRAILHSPRETLVDLDGELVVLGGHFRRFTVVAVGERHAVLRDGAERLVVSIDDERRKPDAPRYR